MNWTGILCLLATTLASAAPRRPRAKRQPTPVVVDPVADADEDEDEDEDEDQPVDRKASAMARDDEDQLREDAAEADVELREVKPMRKRQGTEFYFRAGAAHVEPRIASGGMTLEPTGITKLATPTGPVQGGIETDPSNVLAATIGIAPAVFRGYVGIETIIGVPKPVKLRAKGDLAMMSIAPTALGFVPTGIPALGEELGEATAVPLILTAVFRFPALGPMRFYAGGGASVLIVRDAKITNEVLSEVATPKLEIDPALGVVAQVGVDVQLYKRFYARLDIKELWFQKSESRITNIHVKTTIPLLETVNVGSARSEVQANPLIVLFGIGASF